MIFLFVFIHQNTIYSPLHCTSTATAARITEGIQAGTLIISAAIQKVPLFWDSLCIGSPKTVRTFFVWCYQPEFQVQVDNNNLVEMWEKLVVERSDEEQVEVGVT